MNTQIPQNPALDCGIDPNDGLLVAYLPKLDTVLQEAYFGEYTAHSIDGVLLDVTHPGKPMKWWKVRMVAGDLKLALPDIIWQGRAGDFGNELIDHEGQFRPDEGWKLHMRAYSHGPWICIEDEQLKKVYGENNEQVC